MLGICAVCDSACFLFCVAFTLHTVTCMTGSSPVLVTGSALWVLVCSLSRSCLFWRKRSGKAALYGSSGKILLLHCMWLLLTLWHSCGLSIAIDGLLLVVRWMRMMGGQLFLITHGQWRTCWKWICRWPPEFFVWQTSLRSVKSFLTRYRWDCKPVQIFYIFCCIVLLEFVPFMYINRDLDMCIYI